MLPFTVWLHKSAAVTGLTLVFVKILFYVKLAICVSCQLIQEHFYMRISKAVSFSLLHKCLFFNLGTILAISMCSCDIIELGQ